MKVEAEIHQNECQLKTMCARKSTTDNWRLLGQHTQLEIKIIWYERTVVNVRA